MAYNVICDVKKVEDEEAKVSFEQLNPPMEEESTNEQDKQEEANENNDSAPAWNNQQFKEAKVILQHLQKWSTFSNKC